MPDKDKEIENKNNDIDKKNEKIEELELKDELADQDLAIDETKTNNQVTEMSSCSQVTQNLPATK